MASARARFCRRPAMSTKAPSNTGLKCSSKSNSRSTSATSPYFLACRCRMLETHMRHNCRCQLQEKQRFAILWGRFAASDSEKSNPCNSFEATIPGPPPKSARHLQHGDVGRISDGSFLHSWDLKREQVKSNLTLYYGITGIDWFRNPFRLSWFHIYSTICSNLYFLSVPGKPPASSLCCQICCPHCHPAGQSNWVHSFKAPLSTTGLVHACA